MANQVLSGALVRVAIASAFFWPLIGMASVSQDASTGPNAINSIESHRQIERILNKPRPLDVYDLYSLMSANWLGIERGQLDHPGLPLKLDRVVETTSHSKIKMMEAAFRLSGLSNPRKVDEAFRSFLAAHLDVLFDAPYPQSLIRFYEYVRSILSVDVAVPHAIEEGIHFVKTHSERVGVAFLLDGQPKPSPLHQNMWKDLATYSLYYYKEISWKDHHWEFGRFVAGQSPHDYTSLWAMLDVMADRYVKFPEAELQITREQSIAAGHVILAWIRQSLSEQSLVAANRLLLYAKHTEVRAEARALIQNVATLSTPNVFFGGSIKAIAHRYLENADREAELQRLSSLRPMGRFVDWCRRLLFF